MRKEEEEEDEEESHTKAIKHAQKLHFLFHDVSDEIQRLAPISRYAITEGSHTQVLGYGYSGRAWPKPCAPGSVGDPVSKQKAG